MLIISSIAMITVLLLLVFMNDDPRTHDIAPKRLGLFRLQNEKYKIMAKSDNKYFEPWEEWPIIKEGIKEFDDIKEPMAIVDKYYEDNKEYFNARRNAAIMQYAEITKIK